MLTLNPHQTAPLSEEDARLAELSSRALQDLVGKEERPVLHIRVARPDAEPADLAVPGAAASLLVSVLRELSRGKGVAVVSMDTELTTQQVADFLHVSRPYVVKLLEQGKIPHRKVGVRRRVRLADVLRYMQDSGNEAAQALDEMAALHQSLGLYP